MFYIDLMLPLLNNGEGMQANEAQNVLQPLKVEDSQDAEIENLNLFAADNIWKEFIPAVPDAPLIDGKLEARTDEIRELIAKSEEDNTDFKFFPDHSSNKVANVTDAMKARV